MANDEHLALLRQGTAIWNEWREHNPDVSPDFGGALLSCEQLSKADLTAANLASANLEADRK
jgi:uncharacterized protein YjbI with pentapeptide repeats